MKIELDTTGLVDLICGTTPSGELKAELEHQCMGYEDDDGNWNWERSNLRKFENIKLYQLYKQIRY